ncbi:MAG: OmpH family outer membrane protein, partial [Succiniclasticum sp.]|nr:OmpH family outer membrane protein [Succiniclasticum sp.]
KLSDKEKQALGEKLNRQLAEKEKQLMTPIQEKLKMAIAKAAKEKSVDIVINAREVVYGGIDLTESVKKNMK